MLTVAAYGLAVLLNLFILFIGFRFLLSPQQAAAGYGVPSPAGAYLTVKGDRDVTFGLVGLAVLVGAGLPGGAWFMLAAAVAPLGDMLIVLRHGGSRATAFGVHFATALIVLLSSLLLFLAAARS
ncbi:membrane protein [Paractinoplanes abujensis]|uniref:DUF4267 domain-containing protein n=1 Tax=Paractinoplanes abujensis TaxID=882441 RepID=A0A7W7CSG2_9ACTN|nr:DUF4267 domain-containing protein [Actinoplanes abujensis]MBB4692463.1 hypothetical protein [Actinoplanes abujensis]GID24061.1 membrane protein [Actinoplanes abujensis]